MNILKGHHHFGFAKQPPRVPAGICPTQSSSTDAEFGWFSLLSLDTFSEDCGCSFEPGRDPTFCYSSKKMGCKGPRGCFMCNGESICTKLSWLFIKKAVLLQWHLAFQPRAPLNASFLQPITPPSKAPYSLQWRRSPLYRNCARQPTYRYVRNQSTLC